jgi:hypothetical protein
VSLRCNKTPETIDLREEKFTLVHGFIGFSPWSLVIIALVLRQNNMALSTDGAKLLTTTAKKQTEEEEEEEMEEGPMSQYPPQGHALQ